MPQEDRTNSLPDESGASRPEDEQLVGEPKPQLPTEVYARTSTPSAQAEQFPVLAATPAWVVENRTLTVSGKGSRDSCAEMQRLLQQRNNNLAEPFLGSDPLEKPDEPKNPS